jgi:hypothetical protein
MTLPDRIQTALNDAPDARSRLTVAHGHFLTTAKRHVDIGTQYDRLVGEREEAYERAAAALIEIAEDLAARRPTVAGRHSCDVKTAPVLQVVGGPTRG